MTVPPLLDIAGLTFQYRRATQPALRDISLTLEPGEVLLVAGPSGCGKSTLIRAINGLIPHAYHGQLSGTVALEGRPTHGIRLRDIALIVGTVLQDPSKQIVGSTVEAELAFGPENLGMARDDILERIGEVMGPAGIDSLAGRQTAELSGGESQLLAVAGTLMLRPRIYVLDEPLANLDPATARRLLTLLRDLADAGHTVIIVEHRVEEALALRPDRVLYLEAGETRYSGPADGFLAVADPDAVKLPFDVVLARVRATGRSPHEPSATANPTAAPRPSSHARLTFDDVHVRLGERDVLSGLSASLGASETVAILGPNGSGKTTMFRTAMRLVEPVAGRVLVDGRPTARRTVADLARVFGYVFQSPSQMLFERTVKQEILFGPRNLGTGDTDEDAIVAEALRRAALDDVEGIVDRPPLTLSFGQQKRLALAIALALRPRTLVLDEPSAGQDHRTAERFMGAVAEIPDLDNLYFVTHDVDLALAHADRILVLRNGRIAADGPPLEVIEDEQRWRDCNLHRTSLMAANLAWRTLTGRFLDAPSLARRVAATEPTGLQVGEGGS